MFEKNIRIIERTDHFTKTVQYIVQLTSFGGWNLQNNSYRLYDINRPQWQDYGVYTSLESARQGKQQYLDNVGNNERLVE